MTVVYYCTDPGFATPTLASIWSLRRFHPDVRVRVLCSDFSGPQEKLYHDQLESLSAEMILVDGQLAELTDKLHITSNHVPKSAWARLNIPRYHNSDEDILYLDGDTWIVDVLNELLTLDVHHRFYAAPDGIWFSRNNFLLASVRRNKIYFKSLEVDKFYFNSGVFKTNCGTLRRMVQEIFEDGRCYSAFWKYHDQSALNSYVGDALAPLSIRYNFQTNYQVFNRFYRSNILHFTGAIKPWHCSKHIIPGAEMYFDIFTSFSSELFPSKVISDNEYDSLYGKPNLISKIRVIIGGMFRLIKVRCFELTGT